MCSFLSSRLDDPPSIPPPATQAAWSMASLEIRPPSGWADILVRATRHRLATLQPQQAVHLIWALHRADYIPTADYMDDMLSQVGVEMMMMTMLSIQGIINSFLHHCGALFHIPPPIHPFLIAIIKALPASCLGSSCSPRLMALLVVSLAGLQYKPDDNWTRFFFAACRCVLREIGPYILIPSSLL